MNSADPPNILQLEDGRRLGFACYGPDYGKVVFHFNGSGGSRLERPSDGSILDNLKVRLVSTDRPGHGVSDPRPGRSLLHWPDDIRQLADHLQIDRFFVQGWSAGGPHALVCAHQLPERVMGCALISGLAPPERPDPYRDLPVPNKLLMLAARRMPSLVYLLRRMNHRMIMGPPEEVSAKVAGFFPIEDRQLLSDPAEVALLVQDLQEGYRQGWEGPAQDDILINRPWGFSLEEIQTRVDLWQGEADRNVPPSQAVYQHERLPNSFLTLLPGLAHLYLVTHWEPILAALITVDS